LLIYWGVAWYALAIAVSVVLQLAAMRVLLRDPKGKAPWYNGTGVTLYVLGMMVTAVAIRGLT
jgi:chlorophyll synthase